MKENDVISIESAETLLSHLAEAEDSGAIGMPFGVKWHYQY